MYLVNGLSDGYPQAEFHENHQLAGGGYGGYRVDHPLAHRADRFRDSRRGVLLVERFRGKPTENMLAWALSGYHPRIALASSFSREDIVLIAMMTDIRAEARVLALDTGRLNKERYEAAEAVRRNLGVSIEWHFPDREAVEQLERTKGLHSFRASLEKRHECCRIRKVEPRARGRQK